MWLDYSFPLIMSRVLWRTFHRVVTKQQICNGNYESLKKTFSKESIILWSLQTYRKRKREYPILIKQPEYSHLNIVRLNSPQAAEDWFSTL